MRRFIIEFSDYDDGEEKGVRIKADYDRTNPTATARENRYAHTAMLLIDAVLQNLPTGTLVGAAEGETFPEAEAELKKQLQVRKDILKAAKKKNEH